MRNKDFIEERILEGVRLAKGKEEDMPEKTTFLKNPFLQSEILVQALFKVNNHFLLASVRVNFSEDDADSVDLSDHKIFEFILEVDQLEGKSWTDKITMKFDAFAETLKTFFKLNIRNFITNFGFVSRQKKVISTQLTKYLIVHDSKLHFWHNQLSNISIDEIENKKNLNVNISSEFLTFIKNNQLQKALYFEVFQKFQQRNTISPLNATSFDLKLDILSIDQGNQSVRVVEPNDPKYGFVGEILDKIKFIDGVSLLKNYNTTQSLSSKKFYLTLANTNEKMFIRIEIFKDEKHESNNSIRITNYSPYDGTIDFTSVKDERAQERLINILQINNEKLKEKTFCNMFEMEKTLVGKKINLNEKAKLGRYNKKYEITPDNISLILMTTGFENLSKYQAEFEQHYLTGHVTDLGNCYVNVKTYHFKNLGKFDSLVCLKLEFVPFNCKSKIYKLLINSKDFKYYLNIDYPDTNKYKNLTHLTKLINKLVLKKTTLYSSVEFPIKHHPSLICPKYSYHLKNSITNSIESTSIGAKRVFDNFLETRIQESRMIIQCTKKIKNMYAIITVELHKILDFWTITVYIPKTSRKFMTTFYFSDIMSMNPQFLENMCPLTIANAEDKSIFKDYSKFCVYQENQFEHDRSQDKSQDKSHSKSQTKSKSKIGKKVIKEEDESHISAILSNSLFYLDTPLRNPTGFRFASNKDIKADLANKTKEKLEELPIVGRYNFFELKFWENIINEIHFEKATKNNYILAIDEFHGVLRENIYRNVIKISKFEEALIEIYLENLHKRYDIFEEIPPIPDIYLENHEFFMRITSINKMHTYNNKFKVDKVIKLYESDSITNKMELLNAKKKLSLAKVRVLCQYMIYKIKFWNMVNTTETAISHHKSLNQESILPWTNYSLKLNCNFDIENRIDDKHLYIDQLLIYRAVLSLQPLQLVSIVYDENKDYFISFIYDTSYSWLLQKKVKMAEVISNIPHVRAFLKAKLYDELGRRIYKNFKNSLMIYAYLHRKKIN